MDPPIPESDVGAPSEEEPLFSHCGAVSAPELQQALGIALVEAREATAAWLRLARLAFFPMSCGVQKLAHAMRPYARRAAIAFAAQPRDVLIVEFSLILSVLLIWRVRILLRRKRYFTRLRLWVSARITEPLNAYYLRVKDGVRRRSRFVARALPHLGFAIASLALLRLLRALRLESVLLPIWPSVSWLLFTPVPWIRTLLSLRADGLDERFAQRGWLRFWVLWATCKLTSSVVSSIPFATRLMPTISLESAVAAPMLACVAIWIQLPHDGLELAYKVVGPALAFRMLRLNEALPSLPAGVVDKVALIFRLVLPSTIHTGIMHAAQEGYLLLAVAACMLTPYPLTAFALLYWSLGHPVIKSIEVLEMPTGSLEMAAEAAYSSQVQLRYWLVHCVIAAILDQLPWLRWIPFSTHAQMVLAVWLQLPYFRAATLFLLHLTPFGRFLLGGSGVRVLNDLQAANGANASPPPENPKALRHTRSPRANAIYSKRLQHAGSSEPDSSSTHAHQD